MAITDPLVLAGDVILAPVETLPEAVRAQLSWEAGDWAITRPGSRTPSRLLDAASAELVRGFSEPRTIVEAVLRYSRGRPADAERALEEAYPLLQHLWSESFLAEAGSATAERLRASLAPGDRVGEGGGWEIVSCVQVLADTELYQARGARGWAALKIERQAGLAGPQMEREAAMLRQIEGSPAGAPRLLAAGDHGGRRYLACEWCPGVDAETAAAELRQRGAAGRTELLALLCAGLRVFAALHERGVVHGDVHASNVLVAAGGGVHLIDFGLAENGTGAGAEERPARGGVGFFFEPEFAAAALAGAPPPAATFAGEQYALAALLYRLASGEHYLDFSLERERMLRQILEQRPLAFGARGVAPWPELEELLARALAKEGADRFAGLADMMHAAERLRQAETVAPARGAAAAPGIIAAREIANDPPAAVKPSTGPALPASVLPPTGLAAALPAPALPSAGLATAALSAALLPPAGPAAAALLARVLARTAPDAELFAGGPSAPSASVTFGAAGIGCALHRIAVAWADAALLARADLWCARAAGLGGEEAFYNRRLDITPQTVGRISPYHTASGVWAAAALVARARDDAATRADAAARFAAAVSSGTAAGMDLTLGRSGVLLAASLLLPGSGSAERGSLSALGEETLASLWRELDLLPSIRAGAGGRPLNLGMAHGWAGCLYAALCFCRRAGAPYPAGLERRLAELADCAEPWGRGLRWRWYGGADAGEAGTMPGWCNGSAGFVFLWTLAARLLGDPACGRLAEGAAWNAWEAEEGGGSLCCGLAGRSYALLNLSRHLGSAAWLDRARRLGERAARDIAHESPTPDSLYKGELGVAALAADLQRPATAAFPFFEDEGWP
jgi:tRNA A-37 threonylcarbamoyl transferase component Bud32